MDNFNISNQTINKNIKNNLILEDKYDINILYNKGISIKYIQTYIVW